MADPRKYYPAVKNIRKRLDMCYEKVGGEFIFASVESFSDRTSNYYATAHFKIDKLAHQDIFKLFKKAVNPDCLFNLWRHHSQELKTLEPQRYVGTSRETTELKAQIKLIHKALKPLQKLRNAPFLFFYRPKKANVSGPILRCHSREAERQLESSASWQACIDVTNMKPLPSRPLVSPVKPQPARLESREDANRQPKRARVQLDFDDTPAEMDFGIFEEDAGREDHATPAGGNVRTLVALFDLVTRSAPVVPKIVRCTNTVLKIVMSGLRDNNSGDISPVPVLVRPLINSNFKIQLTIDEHCSLQSSPSELMFLSLQVCLTKHDGHGETRTCTCPSYAIGDTNGDHRCPHTQLVSTYEEDLKRILLPSSPDLQSNVIRIFERSSTRKVVAYYAINHVVRVIYSPNGGRRLSCTNRNHTADCSHCKAVREFEKNQVFEVSAAERSAAAVVVDEDDPDEIHLEYGGEDEEPHHYIKLYKGTLQRSLQLVCCLGIVFYILRC